jgi:hypothetical protein
VLWPARRSIEVLIAGHFGIDPVRLEAEKRAMLDSLRPAPAPSPAETDNHKEK